MTSHAILIEKDGSKDAVVAGAREIDFAKLDHMIGIIGLSEVPTAGALIAGKIRGRLAVAMAAGGRGTSL